MAFDTTESVKLACDLGALPLDSPEAREYLQGVQHIFTDLDGTLLAKGGVLLANAAGEPCADNAVALAKVQAAGIDVVADTGRSAQVSTEIMRLLNMPLFIGEMGAELRTTWSAGPSTYSLGDWDFDASTGQVPLDALRASGMLDELFATWPDQLVWHKPFSDDRTVVALLCGYIDDLSKAQAIADSYPIPITIIDNGPTNAANIVLEACPEMRSYHLVPRGVSKGVALASLAQERGWDLDKCLAIGDAPADVMMGMQAGAVVIPGNSPKNKLNVEAIKKVLAAGHLVFIGKSYGVDIWAEMGDVLLQAKGLNS